MNAESEADQNIPQTIIDRVAETAIASQLKSAQKIDVQLDSNASQLLQVQARSVEIAGAKIIVVKDSASQNRYRRSGFFPGLNSSSLGQYCL
ncbi:MAG: hypothetical protein AAFQ41_10815 [Cyanobacteria bacterium J06623_7]